MMPPGVLERELKTYFKHLAGWVAEGKAGQYVVISGYTVGGFYPDIQAACSAAYERFQLAEFLCKRIVIGAAPAPAQSRRQLA